MDQAKIYNFRCIYSAAPRVLLNKNFKFSLKIFENFAVWCHVWAPFAAFFPQRAYCEVLGLVLYSLIVKYQITHEIHIFQAQNMV